MVFKIIYSILAMTLMSCGQTSKPTTTKTTTVVSQAAQSNVSFNADSAYNYIEKQVSFGPRVPNSVGHRACGNYLADQLKAFGAKVTAQEMPVTAYNGTVLQAKNIIGSYNPTAKKRVLLFAHWDTRPYADMDADAANHKHPIDGADDAGSGVGVLLEIARQFGEKAPEVGVDIIFFDAEDYGTPDFHTGEHAQNTWCLGSQFWAKNPHQPGYRANYGILLDMVGSKNAAFFKEGLSMQYAPNIVDKVWTKARALGYGKYFINAIGGTITDDHQYVNEGRNIPSIDIINYDPDSDTGFGHHWHTMDDTMKNINKETLKAVGQTVLEVIYNEKN